MIFDALRVKIRDEGVVRNKAVYLALGIDRDGHKDVLGLWIEQTEGAGFWLRVMTELKSRGVEDVLIALVDGLVGFPDAITTIFPQAQVHHCVVHLVRQSLRYVSWKDRKLLASTLRGIYRAPTEAAALAALEAFAAGPTGTKYPAIPALGGDTGPTSCRYSRSPRAAPTALHDECDRKSAHAAPEDPQDARPLPDGRSRDEVALPRAGEHHREVAARESRLEGCHAVSRAALWHSVHRPELITRPAYTQKSVQARWVRELEAES